MSATERILNHYIWWATFKNEHALTSDLLARSVIIEMFDWRKIPKDEQQVKKQNVSEKLEQLKAQRTEILADIAWIYRQAETARTPRYLAHSKCSMWSAQMARLLHVVYPEIDCFDFSVNEAERLHYDDECGLLPVC